MFTVDGNHLYHQWYGLFVWLIVPGCRANATCCGHQDTGQGGEVIEKAEGEVGECGNAEDGTLDEPASVPGHEDTGDGGTILAGSAEQTRFITSVPIDILEHGAGEDDAEELVRERNVAEDAREGC